MKIRPTKADTIRLWGSVETLRGVDADQAVPELVVDRALGHVPVVPSGRHIASGGELTPIWVVKIDVRCALFKARSRPQDRDLLEPVVGDSL